MTDKMIPNEALHSYVTSSVFNINLSRNMIFVLDEIANSDSGRAQDKMMRNNFVSRAKSLEARGLIRHMGKNIRSHGYYEPSFAELEGRSKFSKYLSDHWRLTRAGWLVFDLLTEAGMLEPIPKKSKLRKFVVEDALENAAKKEPVK